MHGATSPPGNRGDGLRMVMAVGAELGNMAEAWWSPIVQIPDTAPVGSPRNWGFLFERIRPRSIMVNRAGRRFVDEGYTFSSIAGAFHYLDPRDGYINDQAWVVFDGAHFDHYGAFGVAPGGPVPDWFWTAPDIQSLAGKAGIEADGLALTIERWNRNVRQFSDPDFGRGSRLRSGWSGDEAAETPAQRTLGPIDTPPYYAVPARMGALGTKGGPRTDADGRVRHVLGGTIPGLFAAGNAMAIPTGKAYGGPGAPIGLAMESGYRAGCAAAAGSKHEG
jgi:hypothetical protein